MGRWRRALARRRLARELEADIYSLFQAADYRLPAGLPETLTGEQAWAHFRTRGLFAGADPNRYFDSSWYLAQYPQVAESGLPPVLDYLINGVSADRDPGPEFDTDWYLWAYPDVAAAGANPLAHYLLAGLAEGRFASPQVLGHPWDRALPARQQAPGLGYFDPEYYDRQHGGLRRHRELGLPAAVHYSAIGRFLGASPNPAFDVAWYRARHPELSLSADAFADYLEHMSELPAPNPRFDPVWYAAANRIPVATFLAHWFTIGRPAGAPTCPGDAARLEWLAAAPQTDPPPWSAGPAGDLDLVFLSSSEQELDRRSLDAARELLLPETTRTNARLQIIDPDPRGLAERLRERYPAARVTPIPFGSNPLRVINEVVNALEGQTILLLPSWQECLAAPSHAGPGHAGPSPDDPSPAAPRPDDPTPEAPGPEVPSAPRPRGPMTHPQVVPTFRVSQPLDPGTDLAGALPGWATVAMPGAGLVGAPVLIPRDLWLALDGFDETLTDLPTAVAELLLAAATLGFAGQLCPDISAVGEPLTPLARGTSRELAELLTARSAAYRGLARG
ncbi:MAG: hypothetical protein ACOYEV_00055 [Candidatus Nanopelagicales bacterium]